MKEILSSHIDVFDDLKLSFYGRCAALIGIQDINNKNFWSFWIW